MSKRKTVEEFIKESEEKFGEGKFGYDNTVYIERKITMSKNHVSGNHHTRSQMNDYSNQHNPNNHAYKSNNDNHSNQLNPNNDLYRK